MKKIQNLLLILVSMMLINSTKSFSTTFNVTAANFAFSPANINVTVGDTVKWTRIDGSHTTTCD